MGITGELVKNVFSRNRSTRSPESSARNSMVAKRRWTTVRLYICGEEFNSVQAEEDSASVKSSDTTVTQPPQEYPTGKQDVENEEATSETPSKKRSSTSQLFCQEDAAIIIQSAFRKFLAKRHGEETKLTNAEEKVAIETGSPSRNSVGTSIEVQTGKSMEVLSLTEDDTTVHRPLQRKATTQILKLKEDWDDSTVNLNISKMRIQKRREATTRCERALAYAFSQQLRICSKKKQTRSGGSQSNTSWSWLERWMATRPPLESSVESCTSKQFAPATNAQKLVAKKRGVDIAAEERESCGSNEVSVQFDHSSITSLENMAVFMPNTSIRKGKATKTISRRKTAPSYQCPKEHPVKVKCPSTSNDLLPMATNDKVNQDFAKVTEQDGVKTTSQCSPVA